MVEKLKVSYTLWKSIVDSNSYVQNHVVESTSSKSAYCGSSQVIFITDVSEDDNSDYDSTYPDSILASSEEDAIAAIIGLSATPNPTSKVNNRPIVRSDSRPQGMTTYFTTRGDSLTDIGDGVEMKWDFSNSDDIVTDSITQAIPSGFKRKRIALGFSHKVYIKEGTIYFHGAPKSAFIDFWVICKTGGYYHDPNGLIDGSLLGLTPGDKYTQAVADTPVTHYVNNQFIQGDCPMGDELNTEGASEAGLPTQQQAYEIWIEVTSPDADVISNGYVSLEVYREKTVLVPGESI